MPRTITEALYLCNKENILCHNEACKAGFATDCVLTKYPEYALNSESVDIYSKFIEHFNVQAIKITEETLMVSFVEKEESDEKVKTDEPR